MRDDPIRRQRLTDSGCVLLLAAVLARIVAQEGALQAWEWALILLCPLIIAALLWRLGRTACPPGAR